MGGAIATTLGWRWIFIFSMVVALAALLLIRATPESRSPDACRHKLDISGLVSFVLMLVLFNLFISKGHSWGWSSSLSLLVLCGAVIALMCFVVTGRRKGDAALIDFALFKNRAYSASVFSNFLLNGCIGTMMIASIWLQQGHHLSPLQTGMMTLGYLVTVLAMIRVGEKLLQRYGARLPMMTGPLLTATGITLISCTFLSKEVYIVTVFLSNILFGLGLGCYATPSTDTAVMNAPENKVGVASGIYKMGSSWRRNGDRGHRIAVRAMAADGNGQCRAVCLAFQQCDLPWVSRSDLGITANNKSPALSGATKVSGNVQIFVRLHRQAPVAGDTGFNAQTGRIVFLADRL